MPSFRSAPAPAAAVAIAFGLGFSPVLAIPPGWEPPAPGSAPSYDFDWATIGQPGNRAYEASDGPNLNGFPLGRGSVGYRYNISKVEITSAQWLEFAQAFGPLGDPFRIGRDVAMGNSGIAFGGVSGGEYFFGLRTDVPNAEMMPVRGIKWRNAARYCNWLHNGKVASLEALETGAYDATTFDVENGQYTDNPERLPGAKFWIPSVDEWLKSVHYDRNKHGNGEEGYWLYPTTSDTAPIVNAPSLGGETNAGFITQDQALRNEAYRLKAYEHVTSPWGLWDTSGGASEWMDGYEGHQNVRLFDSAPMGSPGIFQTLDEIAVKATWDPESATFPSGLRIASTVPAPGVPVVMCAVALGVLQRRRR